MHYFGAFEILLRKEKLYNFSTHRNHKQIYVLGRMTTRDEHLVIVPNSKTRPKPQKCAGSFAGIAGSNSAGFMDVCLLWILCERPITLPDMSYRTWCVWMLSRNVNCVWRGLGLVEMSSHGKKLGWHIQWYLG